MDDYWYIWTKARNATRILIGLTTTIRKNRLTLRTEVFWLNYTSI